MLGYCQCSLEKIFYILLKYYISNHFFNWLLFLGIKHHIRISQILFNRQCEKPQDS